jgi:hypothetical protein
MFEKLSFGLQHFKYYKPVSSGFNYDFSINEPLKIHYWITLGEDINPSSDIYKQLLNLNWQPVNNSYWKLEQ